MERIVGVQKDRINVENNCNVKGFATDYPANLPYSYLPGVTYNQSFAPPLSHRVYPPLRRTGSLSSGSDSAFSPVRSTKSDEHFVSSATEDVHRNKRSGSPAPSDVDWKEAQSSDDQGVRRIGPAGDEFLLHPQRTNHSKTETAAATSTTSSEEDEERLRMQNQGSRGRRGAIGATDHRPPSCGTPLGKITEESNASKKIQGKNSIAPVITKGDDIYQQRNDGFLAPMAPDVNRLSNHQHPHYADAERRSGNFFIQPHIPVDSKIRDGRYPFDPRQLSMPEEIAGSTLPDISVLPISPHSPLYPPVNGAPGVFMGQRSTGNAPLDLYMRSLTSPTMSILSQARGLSPRHSIQGREGENLPYPYYGNPANSAPNSSAVDAPNGQVSGNFFQNGHPQSPFNTMAYYQLAQQQSWLAAVASAGGVDRSLAMSFDRSGDMSRLSSPFCMRRQGRKRALSISPSQSDISLDLMIRTSPNSLLPFANGVGSSRSSSIGSAGSYGHLSARGISPQMSFHTRLVSPMHTQLLSNRLAAASAGFSPGILGSMIGQSATMNQGPRPQSQFHPGQLPNAAKHMSQYHTQLAMIQYQDILSNKAEKHQPYGHGIIKTEPHSPAVTTSNRTQHANPSRNQDETETVYETNCGWENCLREFDTQEQLVHHINNDHIHGEKKEFVCRWRDCARDQKPFKAQYMLVVHMRRHTGEKPHTCSFEGCTKAYSRLENLKTHLRSHTGEKPYVCEFPGCTKAFSNASDRAKHQNRTHSNEKPYVCRIPNCTKRYTDPSSLRKHVKTVHGPDAHVTKRMKAERRREDAKNGDGEERTIKQESDSAKSRAENDENNNTAGQSCKPSSRGSQQNSHDTNAPGNTNPRSNQSSCTSGSDVSGTPQNSPHANPQHNNDSGVELNTGYGNDHDSDGDIVVDGNPLPDSTSGGVGVQSRRRTALRSNLIPRMVNQKMQSLSLGNAVGSLPYLGPDALEDLLPTFPNPKIEKNSGNFPYHHYSPQSVHSGNDEVSSTTLSSPQSHARSQSKPNIYAKTQHSGMSSLYRQVMLAPPDRRDSGTSSGHPSRKPSGISNASRRSSQASNQLAVAGSYDPISLGSSRKSSGMSVVPGNGGSASSPSLPSLNPYTLHRLTSKYNEVTGRPPPTPLGGDTHTRSQLGKWLQEDADARVHGGLSTPSNVHQQPNNSGYPGNMGPPASIPPHNRHNNATMLPNRRRSDAPFRRGVYTPLPHEIPNNENRRASDPIKKPSQHPDPSRLPNVQRYHSWNNMNPLPGIRNFHNQSSQMYNSQGGMPGNFGYNNFLSSGNLQVGRQRSDSNGSFFSSESGYQSNGSNLALNCAAEYQNSPALSHHEGTGGQYYNPNHPGRNHLQSVQNLPPPTGVNENQLQENLNADMMSGMGGIFQDDQAQGYMNQTMMNTHQRQLQQNHGAYGAPEMFQQNYAQQPYHQFLQTPNHSGYGENDGGQAQNYGIQDAYHRQIPRDGAAIGNPGVQTYPQSSQGYYYQNYANQYPARAPMAPRPPSSSNSAGVANVNRHRMTRVRNPNQRVQPSSTSQGQGPGQIDSAPDMEIPISYLEQEFIDCIPTFRVPESFGDTERNRGYVKMPADSTTGPDGGQTSNEPRLRRPPEMDDNFDAMSGTNTDVTLPSMSGLSSRLATPTLEKPYSASLQQQEMNEQMSLNVAECWDVSPTANMALNSMSSMLSTLAEENKFLQMMPQ